MPQTSSGKLRPITINYEAKATQIPIEIYIVIYNDL